MLMRAAGECTYHDCEDANYESDGSGECQHQTSFGCFDSQCCFGAEEATEEGHTQPSNSILNFMQTTHMGNGSVSTS